MLSKLLVTAGVVLSLLSMSDSGNNVRCRKPSGKYSLSRLFEYEEQGEAKYPCSLSEVFNPPVSDEPVDVENLSLYDMFKP